MPLSWIGGRLAVTAVVLHPGDHHDQIGTGAGCVLPRPGLCRQKSPECLECCSLVYALGRELSKQRRLGALIGNELLAKVANVLGGFTRDELIEERHR